MRPVEALKIGNAVMDVGGSYMGVGNQIMFATGGPVIEIRKSFRFTSRTM